MSLKEQIDSSKIPSHIAIIMDGNGRWAKKRGKLRIFGHQSAVKAVKETVESAAELGVKFLTLYTFSAENWNRPQFEVNALMELLVNTIAGETKTLMENNIRLVTIGDLSKLPTKCNNNLNDCVNATANNNRMTLVLALSYGSRIEIVNAVKDIVSSVQQGKLSIDDLDQTNFGDYLNTANIPDPELLIRTSGEYRISNFLLWQIAYSELYFTTILWPDFRKEDLYEAIVDYQNRERRFGKTSDQLKS